MPNDPFVQSIKPLIFTNYHENVKVPIGARWRVTNESLVSVTNTMKLAAERIRRLLAQAVAAGARVRACGARWSFSDIAVVEGGWLIETDQLNLHRMLKPENMDPGYRGTIEELVLVQGGKAVAELNEAIETAALKRALRTSGASNGQTIAGALGTGCHGSAIDVGAMESQVVGLQLVTANRILWLERANAPVLHPGYVKLLGAELVRDTEQFEAALVSVGSLGVITAVLQQTTARYLMKSAVVHLPYAQLQRALDKLDYSGLALPEPTRRPYFFQTIVDPADMTKAYVTVRYKQVCPPDYVPNYSLVTGHEPGTDVPLLISEIIKAIPRLRDKTVSTLLSTQLAENRGGPENTPGEVNTFTDARNGIASSAFAIPASQTTKALEVARRAFQDIPGATVIFTCRFAQRSLGTMSFIRFDPTCIFDLDGVNTPDTQRLIGLVADRFDAAGIPYTQHWGKELRLTKDRVRRGYGGNVDRWNAARRKLLPTQAERNALSSPYFDLLGLNG